MNMEVRRTLAKCNRVNTITTCSSTDKIAGVLQRTTPVRHLTISELPGPGTMTDGVEQEPPQQWGRITVMPKHPTIGVRDHMVLILNRVLMQCTDRTFAGGIESHRKPIKSERLNRKQ